MRSRWGRNHRPLLHFLAVLALATAVGRTIPVASAQTVQGWQVSAGPHVSVYAVPATAGARDAAAIMAQLERMYAEVLAPLGLPPTRILFPLYPSPRRFSADWWQFASLGYGDVVHAWGVVYEGEAAEVSPYMVTRGVVGQAFPRAIPFLRWGLGDALGDRAGGVDAHRHVRALLAAGRDIPEIRSIVAPSDFGQALPMSYPVAVSFMAFLIDAYGPARTAEFAARVEFRYYDFAAVFAAVFGVPLGSAEAAWRRRVSDEPVVALDLPTYLDTTRFVYRATLAASPARLLLEPVGALVVREAIRAIRPLRQLDVRSAAAHMAVAAQAEERAEHRQQLTTTTVRGAIGALIISPLVLAIGWLLWPSLRARLHDRRRTRGLSKGGEVRRP